MLLSKLAYECVKNVIYLNDTSFNEEDFLLGNFDSDPDYDTHINNVFNPLNEAIARLSDLERIPYKVKKVNFINGTKTIDLNNLLQTEEAQDTANVKELHAVGQLFQGEPEFLEAKLVGDEVLVIDKVHSNLPIYIEYKEDIPYFSRLDIPNRVYSSNDEELEENDVDLKDYGISDSMCNFIIEYVQGKLFEQIEPSLANMHVTRAEAYFNNIRTVRPLFTQRKVKKIYSIED